MLTNNEEFLKALPELFSETKESGGVTVTIKRYDYQGQKQQRQKRRIAHSKDEEAMRLLVDSLSLDDHEYATLVRAATQKKKLSTLVAPADLDEFLARYHGLLLICVDSIKKNERLRKKKAAIKRQAAQKAKAAKAKTKKQEMLAKGST
ncbi:hypothetical protein GGI25_003473 [Coemansia spiralis]|uniref:Signal recognition particle subunit SRP14 n=2 Tax=Coemansia TaxID=4863 RepID=A0A9W8G8H8_9FUNG|nr:signal recognition particle, SRP9/SRP14 subunit [Coemansia spiralis]KAJ1991490.1 hypothetical protein EDC05_003414 [Coemansia umbellata]KAJ2621556.1 hypothetical protein GGI26_004019 [Coemansia sp. RSA 1358]KAJ2676721.1 hypothetical protein GGI25_003473 [Coemansia spiralis]